MTRSCSGWYMISQATSQTNSCCPGLLLILFNLAPDHTWFHRQCPGLLLILFNLAPDHIWPHQQFPRPTLDVPDHDAIMLQTISQTNFHHPGLLLIPFNLAPDHIWSHRQCPRLSLDFTLDVLDYYRYCSILLQTIYGLISNPPDRLGMSQTMTQSCSRSYPKPTFVILDYYWYHSILLQTIHDLTSNSPDQLWMSRTMTQSCSRPHPRPNLVILDLLPILFNLAPDHTWSHRQFLWCEYFRPLCQCHLIAPDYL